jgi:hypothetical protein
LKAPDVRFPIPEIETASNGVIWHGEKSRNGVACHQRRELHSKPAV